ncbi:unnamed protein product [Rotaria sp. Silwood2]|nr:unnamed protein product [Rotaria sp. Silwood2]CAF3030265.1 unnamed protein product [Rotaria sp. Silwood2]CAF4457906.1 unnamed protein product [Rotaria sp. Silwood2]CAF4464848.1 unnamed protein product [Rotaria sp. Silwood2]
MAAIQVADQEITRRQRFSDIEENPRRKLMPISGYEETPIVTLEKAVEPLEKIVRKVKDNAAWAKWKCEDPPADNLSVDQSAAIILYTMEMGNEKECVYHALNSTLRNEDRKTLKPWFLYLRLLLSALSLLPTLTTHVYREVRGNLQSAYKAGEKIIWWGFSSCTTDVSVLSNYQFFGSAGVRIFFSIDCKMGKDIKNHSAFPKECEILLPAARCFQVVACLLQSSDMTIIQLKEVDSPVKLIELGSQVT